VKKLIVSVSYKVTGEAELLIPDWMTIDDAIEYAEEHIEYLTLPEEPECDPDSVTFNIHNCGFEESNIVEEKDRYLEMEKSCA